MKIGYEKNKDIGLVGTIKYQTPTNNPQANERTHQTNQRTNEKIKRAHADNIKHSTRTQRKTKGETQHNHDKTAHESIAIRYYIHDTLYMM